LQSQIGWKRRGLFAQATQSVGLNSEKADARRFKGQEMLFGSVENLLVITHQPQILAASRAAARQSC
jgi:hypothetical protein